MTSQQLIAEIDKLLADQARTQEALIRIDGALQAFRYMLAQLHSTDVQSPADPAAVSEVAK